MFEKIPLDQLFAQLPPDQSATEIANQLILFH